VVPVSATNLLSLGCCVTASAVPVSGELSCVTDGDKEHDGPRVELPGGVQWIQLDLGKTQEIWAVSVWHWYEYSCVYHDVICQLSDDPFFGEYATVVFNNDHDCSAGQGTGSDKEYIEGNEGRAFAVNGVRARYLRFFSNGCTETPMNRYTEIEVFGRQPTQSTREDEKRVPLRIDLPKPIFM
jgi:hypothetical protein